MGFITIIGTALRSFFLDWQPLWWDEGYSVYVATEPLVTMLWLTAHDIHPPLYYALLHGWIQIWQSAAPEVLRLFSVLIGVLSIPLFALLAQAFYPNSQRFVLLSAFLLALSPMHLFYSQEVRMYGLAVALGIASTLCLWKFIVMQVEQRRTAYAYWLGYIIFTCLALHTLYYIAFLFLAHFIWSIWHYRQNLRRLIPIITALTASTVIYLPWLLYTVPLLVEYVVDKVASDQDQPLSIVDYLIRHSIAFTSGHLQSPFLVLRYLTYLGVLITLGLVGLQLRASAKQLSENRSCLQPNPDIALSMFFLIPAIVAFGTNLTFPFAPEGGERLLLFVLPYFLLIAAHAMDQLLIARFAVIAMILLAGIGIYTFYTLPRYTERDYRPIVAQVLQQGARQDTLLTIFPWQVGYWRAYAPFPDPGPSPHLIGQGSLEWHAATQQQVDNALVEGTLWFPEPLSLGTILPEKIENYLWQRSRDGNDETLLLNLEDRWVNPTTRLTGWHHFSSLTDPISLIQIDVDASWALRNGTIHLVDVAITQDVVTSANQVIGIILTWALPTGQPQQGIRVSLRLRDEDGRVWATRDYEPLGKYSVNANRSSYTEEHIGFIIPAGLAPGNYDLVIGLSQTDYEHFVQTESAQEERDRDYPLNNHRHPALSGRLLQGQLQTGETERLITLTNLQVHTPNETLSEARLPVQNPLDSVFHVEGISLLGNSSPVVSGGEIGFTLYFQSEIDQPPERHIFASILNRQGEGVAGWEGWPLSDYPTNAWQDGALIQVPVHFYLPADLASGDYQLITGLLDPVTGIKSRWVALGDLEMTQRPLQEVAPALVYPFLPAAQFGTHVKLLGYEFYTNKQTAVQEPLELRLSWQVQQSLLPSHHIFVHLTISNREGQDTILVQTDGLPQVLTAGGLIDAPTGGWRAGEYLTTVHQLPLPDNVTIDFDHGRLLADTIVPNLMIGLYEPETGIRLPVSIDGQTIGDSVQLPQ
ncbi:glycosyltransferase family 39 protein [Chloroflexi bacterium TSY]|nr:glycosyltransferase family 39 protein [Chloroflexi bacterium TSY]